MKKILFIIIVVVLLFITKDLTQSIFEIWQKKDFVNQAEQELSYQKQENQRLKSELSYSKTSEFVEKEARDKLFMVKQGEQRVLVPKDSENADQNPQARGANLPNWQQWWNLFF